MPRRPVLNIRIRCGDKQLAAEVEGAVMAALSELDSALTAPKRSSAERTQPTRFVDLYLSYRLGEPAPVEGDQK